MFFETFTGSVQYTGPEKFPRKATCVQAFFFCENPRILVDAKEQVGLLTVRLNKWALLYYTFQQIIFAPLNKIRITNKKNFLYSLLQSCCHELIILTHGMHKSINMLL